MIAERTQASWDALGMRVAVEVTDPAQLDRARSIVAAELAAADDAYSPVRDDTELARVHAGAAEPGALLREALDAAGDASAMTGGLVDPCPAPGARPDLGATGKALIADRAAGRIASASCGALVSVGGDVATAGPSPAGGWPVRVADDSRAAAGGRVVALPGGALATSSTTVRGAHIRDPRTGRPASGPWRTASVAAATCVDANAASTAALILGDAAPAWLLGAGLPALLIAHDGRAVRVGGWPA